ncbi:Regulator of chromosome condensation (RCC1) repeat [Novymonas esmeraldas]|uniref:Regulator of chromosome condensation (RCC1) repeat n=1 Tax=Novymonas esmeraldas TaxID=1808958 RepID=A0AAW0F4K9_9TRYP
MITDAEFWLETRRGMSGGECIFSSMLSLIHARQCAIDARVTTAEREEYKLTAWGQKHRDEVTGRVFLAEERREMDEEAKAKEAALRDLGRPMESNKVFRAAAQPPDDSGAQYGVSSSTMRVLQQVMMFAVPIYALRYNVPAMSMGWNTSCFIDRQSKQLITFGSGHGVKVPQHLRGRGCVAGDGFFAILTNQDEVWSSGGLKVSSSSIDGPTALGREDAMTGIAGKTLMLVGHGQRLAAVTRAFTVRPLSALSNPTRSIIPTRHVRFLDLGYGEDYYMVGTDSIVYKTTASKRAVGTPRRVMALCRTPASRVASGMGFLLIIDQNGHLYSFGRNKKGQLGNGEVQEARRKPHLHERLRHHFFVQVAAGECHSLALTSNGIVYGAGSNEGGQLGLGRDVKLVSKFTPIPLGGGDVRCIGIAAGPVGSMFYCDNGRVLTCGLNDSMQLGLESAEKVVYDPTPVTVLVDGVESYTMDFGGFRKPESSEAAASAEGTGAAAAAEETGGISVTSPAAGGSFRRQRMASIRPSQEVTVISLSETPGNNTANATHASPGPQAAARRGENGEARENHQPVDDDAPVHPAAPGPRKGSVASAARPTEKGKSGTAAARNGGAAGKQKSKCGCCAVM